MPKLKLRGKDLIKLGYAEGPHIGRAIDLVQRHYKHHDQAEALALLADLRLRPEAYLEDGLFAPVAKALLGTSEKAIRHEGRYFDLDYHNPKPWRIFGSEHIADNAREQMENAMRLPIALSGALMPDAHHGYGLPIGGVLATREAVIPYAVGVDIGCRMCLSLFDLPPARLIGQADELEQLLIQHSRFGGEAHARPSDHAVLAHPAFKDIAAVRKLHGKAVQQIGSSGGGNHFVEFGQVRLDAPDNPWGLPTGDYFALLSHSGSRGLGAGIAHAYTQIAMARTQLPKQAKHLAWLPLDSAEGQEYWAAMNLAGDYASACHHDIHARLARALGAQVLARVENHHNFAWREQLPDGSTAIVHRKGATPAGKGVLGIIPGSMSSPGYIVRGKGEPSALQSASHGAGRRMSRSEAKASISARDLKRHVAEKGIRLIGSGPDEAPMAYKDIEQIMAVQQDLVEVLGQFWPKIVRMA